MKNMCVSENDRYICSAGKEGRHYFECSFADLEVFQKEVTTPNYADPGYEVVMCRHERWASVCLCKEARREARLDK